MTPATITVVLPTSHLLAFTVPGEPVSKARASRAQKRGGGTCTSCSGWVSKPTYRVCSACKRKASGRPALTVSVEEVT